MQTKTFLLKYPPANHVPPTRDLDDGWAECICPVCRLWFSIPAGKDEAPCPYPTCKDDPPIGRRGVITNHGHRHQHRDVPTADANGHFSRSSPMAEMIYGQTIGISVPAGRYTARFIGTEERPDMVSTGNFGKPAGVATPRQAWIFEIVDGPHKGERIPQETGTSATLRSAALKMLTGLNGGPMAIGQRVNTNTYVGRLYVLKVAPNADSPKGNLHIADIEPAGTTAPASPPPPARPAAPPPRPELVSGPLAHRSTERLAPPLAPPPRQQAPAAPPPPPEVRYWLDLGDGEEATALTLAECRKAVEGRDHALCNWSPQDGKGGWHTVDQAFLSGGDPFPG